MARKEETARGAASWLRDRCAKVVLEEKLPLHRQNSGRTALLVLFTLPDATRKLQSRLRPRCAPTNSHWQPAPALLDLIPRHIYATVSVLHFLLQGEICHERTPAVVAALAPSHRNCCILLPLLVYDKDSHGLTQTDTQKSEAAHA